MGNLRLHFIYLIIIAFLSCFVVLLLKKPEKIVEVTIEKTDTLTIVTHDTLTITKVIEVEKKVVDTVYVTNNGNDTPIPISQYRFFKENEYDITAMGFNVTIPKITVFPKTEYRTVTNTIEKEVIATNWDFFFGGGLWRYNQEWIPHISFAAKAPQKWLFFANLGYYNNNIMFGGTILYNIKKHGK